MANSNIAVIDTDSSSIRTVAYNPVERTLLVMFRSGSVYVYQNVPAQEFANLLTADSQGNYLARHIVANPSYLFQRVV